MTFVDGQPFRIFIPIKDLIKGLNTVPSIVIICLVRIQGSIPAETCVQFYQKALERFGLSLKDHIVCVTTDGASVMTKVGKIIDPEQQ